MSNPVVYDAHCHIFNLKYAIKEIENMLWDKLTGQYPENEEDKSLLRSDNFQEFLDDLKTLLRELYEFLSAALDDEEANLNFMQKTALKTWKAELKITPLMMDIFYLLAPPLNQDIRLNYSKINAMAKPANSTEFKRYTAEILNDFKDYIRHKDFKNKLLSSVQDEKAEILEFINDELERVSDVQLKVFSQTYPFQTSWGFKCHMENLINLVAKRKGELYPFLAVDPRRPNIVEGVKDTALVSPNGPFYGIKLYPRMGYHPLSQPMYEVYDYCKKNKIPIVVHTGIAGFPPQKPDNKWKYYDFGNPKNFEPVLDDDLIINFAHLGSSDPSFEWAQTIAEYMGKYKQVYSDLSCYTSKNEIDEVKKRFWNDENPELKRKMMFGTDFDIMYATDIVTLESYYQNFTNSFTADELNNMTQVAPKMFLGISE
jgi:predicted TIM-barrel fold metal-dependent hydrolase